MLFRYFMMFSIFGSYIYAIHAHHHIHNVDRTICTLCSAYWISNNMYNSLPRIILVFTIHRYVLSGTSATRHPINIWRADWGRDDKMRNGRRVEERARAIITPQSRILQRLSTPDYISKGLSIGVLYFYCSHRNLNSGEIWETSKTVVEVLPFSFTHLEEEGCKVSLQPQKRSALRSFSAEW